jgi:hypothetical protein
MEEAGLDEDALRSAALAGGGAFYREEDLHKLADQIAEQKARFSLRQERPLGGTSALLAFVLLITAEWLLRKFSNLS